MKSKEAGVGGIAHQDTSSFAIGSKVWGVLPIDRAKHFQQHPRQLLVRDRNVEAGVYLVRNLFSKTENNDIVMAKEFLFETRKEAIDARIALLSSAKEERFGEYINFLEELKLDTSMDDTEFNVQVSPTMKRSVDYFDEYKSTMAVRTEKAEKKRTARAAFLSEEKKRQQEEKSSSEDVSEDVSEEDLVKEELIDD